MAKQEVEEEARRLKGECSTLRQRLAAMELSREDSTMDMEASLSRLTQETRDATAHLRLSHEMEVGRVGV